MDSRMHSCFEELKSRLLTAPILAYPDFTKPFILDTDACQFGIGAVLSQEHNGEEKVVAYGSRVLSKAERRYCVTRKELLAVVCFAKHFRSYLLGRRFTLRTDHSSLQWLYNMKEPEGQLARWLEQLQEFDFVVIHRRGSSHGNADALSRAGQASGNGDGEPELGNKLCSNNGMISAVKHQQDAKTLHQLQVEDENVGVMLKAVSSGKKVSPQELEGRCKELSILVQHWEQLVLKDGILHRRYENNQGKTHLQVVAPAAIRKDILRQLHEGVMGGHLGEAKTLSRLKERFYWPGHAKDVQEWCSTCPKCARRKTPSRSNRAPLRGVSTGYPMQIVAVDIVGPISPGETTNRYILVASDYFTRWVEAYAIPNQEAVTVADKLIDEFFCRFSIPLQLHSDQGRQFEADVMREVCRLLQINKTRTTPYHPQSDGLVERFNRTLINMLAATVQDHPTQWESHLKKMCMAYNTSVHPSTGFSPFYLMFGRDAKLPVDIVYGDVPEECLPQHEYARRLKDTLQKAFDVARRNLNTNTERMKDFYDQKIHGKPYDPGDLVWLHNPAVPKGKSRKLHSPWSGPYKVVKRLSTAVYRIQDQRGGGFRRKRRLIVHFDRLKPCPKGIRFDGVDSSDVNPQEPDLEPSATQEHPRGPRRPGTTLQLFDVDDEDEGEEQAVYRNTQQLPIEVPTQVEQPAVPTAAVDEPPPRRYPTRIRRPPDRL